jgi:YidC/Oxa1 family membrane protein insertase
MHIWESWLEVLRMLLGALNLELGLGLGIAVIAATLLLRVALLPVSWTTAYRNAIRQKKMKQLQPQLEELKSRLAGDKQAYARELLALHKSQGLTLVDGKALLGAFAQIPVFMGMFHVLRGVGDGRAFLWIANLARPDAILALIAGVTTALMVAVNPDMPEQMKVLMIVVPSILAVVSALHFSSALALYWTTSNLFSAGQTLLVHAVANRRMRNRSLAA